MRCVYRYVYGQGSPFRVEEPENTGDYYLNVVAAASCRAGMRPSGVSVVYGQGDVFRRATGKVEGRIHDARGRRLPARLGRAGERDGRDLGALGVQPPGLPRLAASSARSTSSRSASTPTTSTPGRGGCPNPTGDFVFLANFEWGERKEPVASARGVQRHLPADEPVVLVCKISNRDPGSSFKTEIRALGLKASGGRISFLFNLDFPHAQLPMLYRSADCFLAVSRGEGWDMPLMEAMACGLPTIATDWSAHTEFVHDGIGYRLRTAGTIPAVAKCPYYDGFRWADPDHEHLRTLLRHVYEHRDEARAKGAAAAPRDGREMDLAPRRREDRRAARGARLD